MFEIIMGIFIVSIFVLPGFVIIGAITYAVARDIIKNGL